MRIAWLTDIHLNFVEDEYALPALIDTVEAQQPGAVLIGGDIGEADSFTEYLEVLASGLSAPIYFVLGNHDYYRGSIASVRQEAETLSRHSRDITWLPSAGAVSLADRVALVGDGGWGDARAGSFANSNVVLNDYLLIDELRSKHRFPEQGEVLTPELAGSLQALGDESAKHFRTVLPQAAEIGREILVLMHVPPFHEACWHAGKRSDNDWAPHFVCVAAGEALRRFMEQHPTHQMTVLCGHTHSEGVAQILPNLLVRTGGAEYRRPALQPLLEF